MGVNGLPTSALPAPNYVNAVSLGVATAESVTIPSGAKVAVFSSTGNFYANYAGTATVPGDTTDGTASELNPTVRELETGETISVISPAAAVVTVAFYN